MDNDNPPIWEGADWWHPEEAEEYYRFHPSIELARLAIDIRSLQEALSSFRSLEIYLERILYVSGALLLLGIGALVTLVLVTDWALPATPAGRVILGLVIFGFVLSAGAWLQLVNIRRRAEWAASRDRIEVTPQGLSSPTFGVRLASAQESISERVGRVLAAFAYQNMNKESHNLKFGTEGAFDSAVEKMLRKSLPVPDKHVRPFFSLLYTELLKAAQNDEVGGDWGKLYAEGNSLTLSVRAVRTPQPREDLR